METLVNKNIFILGLMKFDSEIESTNYTIAKYLAQKNNVYYIDNPFTWKDCFSYRKTEAFQKRSKYFLHNPEDIIDTDIPNLKIIITPPLMSINWMPEGRTYRSMLKLNEWIVYNRVQKIISKYKIENYIYINSFNFYYPGLARLLSPELVVYHCVDPLILAFERKHGLLSEEKIVQESDLIICTSKQLHEEKRKLNKNSYFIPNAADINHSSKALLADLPIHDSLKAIKGPVVGYFGNIERRIDYSLLKHVIEQHPDKSFVFAGPVLKRFVPEWLYEKTNVHFIGPIAYQQMPQVLKGFDVCMIPFMKDEVSANIFPLKLFEYLGAGKPVIASDFNPDLKEYTGSTVEYCPDAESFSSAIDAVLAAESAEMKASRIAIARDNTWEQRAQEYAQLLETHIKLKVPGHLVVEGQGQGAKAAANTFEHFAPVFQNSFKTQEE